MLIEIDDKTAAYIKDHGGEVTVYPPKPAAG